MTKPITVFNTSFEPKHKMSAFEVKEALTPEIGQLVCNAIDCLKMILCKDKTVVICEESKCDELKSKIHSIIEQHKPEPHRHEYDPIYKITFLFRIDEFSHLIAATYKNKHNINANADYYCDLLTANEFLQHIEYCIKNKKHITYYL